MSRRTRPTENRGRVSCASGGAAGADPGPTGRSGGGGGLAPIVMGGQATQTRRRGTGGHIVHAVRTPDEQFVGLPDFPFAPSYVDVPSGAGTALRVHYLDEGDPTAPTVLLMHGEPSWCFLYRHMIPVLVDAGLRCVAPDLVGFGRSDKPAERTDYTYARHVAWMQAFFDATALDGVTLVCQDWGGLI